jgi:hypothetical protein
MENRSQSGLNPQQFRPTHQTSCLGNSDPLVNGHHTRAREIINEVNGIFVDRGKARTLQSERNSQGTIAFGNTEIAEYQTQFQFAVKMNFSRKCGGGTYDFAR